VLRTPCRPEDAHATGRPRCHESSQSPRTVPRTAAAGEQSTVWDCSSTHGFAAGSVSRASVAGLRQRPDAPAPRTASQQGSVSTTPSLRTATMRGSARRKVASAKR
jgi:hypothetical protein